MASPDACDLADYLVRYVPAGPEREQLLSLVRVGRAFQAQQHCGRRHGYLRQYLMQIVKRLKSPCSFAALIAELELEAARRSLHGEKASPVEDVRRPWELVTIHYPGRGARQVTFKTIRNTLTACNKICR